MGADQERTLIRHLINTKSHEPHNDAVVGNTIIRNLTFDDRLDDHAYAMSVYVRFPLSLRNVEDLLHERGIDIYWLQIT